MKFGSKQKILLVLVGALALTTGLSALVASYFTREPVTAILAVGAVALLLSISLGRFWLNRFFSTMIVEPRHSSETIEPHVRSEVAREAALSEAERLSKLHSEFLARMSHELRTPLNAMLGYAQILRRDRHLTERQARGLATIEDSGHHLLTLINDIQDFSRITASKLELHPADTDLPALLRSVCDIIRVKAEEKGLVFAHPASPDLPPTVHVDGKRLRQVLLNLLGNAVKFTDSGRIELRVTKLATPGEKTGGATARLLFEVEDSGIGMTEHQMEKIFLPFERAADAERRQGGTGLGLAISRQLVRVMGGDIQVRSEPGHGSAFRFELEVPIVESEPDTEQNAQSAVEDSQEKIIPPLRELETLYELALTGNMRDIHDRASQLKNADPRYGWFAQHLQSLAKGYQSHAILTLVERYKAQAASRTTTD